MLQRTADYMKGQHIKIDGEKMIIGLSGGMDSVCLFHILKDLGASLEAVHVNHQIRGEEADRDELFAKELCAQYNIPSMDTDLMCRKSARNIICQRKRLAEW